MILASNTSSIPITTLAAATGSPDGCRHALLQPGPVMQLVEVVRGLQTSTRAAAIVALAGSSGKTRPGEGLPGFVSNRILMPIVNEAAYALRKASAGGGHRHGHEARLEPPDGPARPGRPDRPRYVRSIMQVLHRDSATPSTRPARSCASTSRRDGSGGSGPGLLHYDPTESRESKAVS